MILQPRACVFVTNKAAATLLQTVTFSERDRGSVKTAHDQKFEQRCVFEMSSPHVPWVSKNSEGFVSVAKDGRFMAMVKHSAKTRLPSHAQLA
jgi:hypothetical protein